MNERESIPDWNRDYSIRLHIQTETEIRQNTYPREMRPGFLSGLLLSGAEMSKLF
jgi:hypothetical protein